MRKRLRTVLRILVLLGLMLVVGWFTGAITHGLLYLAENHLLPYRTGKEFTFTQLVLRDPSQLPAIENRVRLTISQNRIRQVLDESGGWHWAVPPGLLRDGLLLGGDWFPYSRGQKVGIAIPVEVVIGETEGDHPALTGRLPVSMLNAYMDVEFEEDFVTEDEEYLLGHFDYTFRPTILEASIRTTNSPSLPPATYAEALGLEVRAKGTVRLKFEENLFRASTTADIGDLHLVVTAFTRDTEDGLVLDYDAVFKRLRGNVRKLHSYGDKKVSEKLRKKWTRSLNRDKRKRKLARNIIPPWFPLDLVIDLQFHPDKRTEE